MVEVTYDIQSAGVTWKMRSRSPKSNHFFLMSQWCFSASLSKSTNCFRRWECRQGSFLVFIVWWPRKWSEGHQHLIISCNYPNDTINKVWPEYIIWFTRYECRQAFWGQNLTFKVLIKVCVCVFGFNVAFNNFSVISRRCLVATGSSMLTFIVLPHWSIMSQALDMIPHPVTLSWHWVDQS